MGRSLNELTANFQRIMTIFEEIKNAEVIYTLQAFWQMILNLQMPFSESSKKLEGEYFSPSLETTETPLHLAAKNFCSGELLLFFGDHEARAERLMEEEKGNTLSGILPGFFFGNIDVFHIGIVWFDMARKHKGKRKYRSKALKIKNIISKWATAGGPNVQHYDQMLSAEMAVLEKKYDLAEQFYKDAIVGAARIGCLHHAALFNERFAEYQLERCSDKENSKYYMKQAIKYYRDWGANGKAEELCRNLSKD